jgi:signal transduction histidine kinase
MPARADSNLLDHRAVIWAEGRDGSLTREFLHRAGKDAIDCPDGEGVARELAQGAGVLIVAAELLHRPDAVAVCRWMVGQPPWSDLPVLVISGRDGFTASLNELLSGLGTFSVLHRPLSLDTLYSTVETALRARQRQYQIRDLLAQRDQSDRRREEFLAMLAHELRNPLAPIRTGMQVLRLNSPADAKSARTHEMIERQLTNLTRLINDLLDVSRITQGKISLQREVLDLHQAVAIAVAARSMHAAEKGLRITLSSPPLSPLHVSADPVRIEQIVDNVLTNAIKFTAGGGSIDVSVTREQDTAVIRVSDTGIGIPPHLLSTVFDLFAQTPRSLDRSQGGLGIGLTVVKSLVELHGGVVRASSAGEGQGTLIEIRVPTIQVVESAPKREKHVRLPAITTPRKVLLVEDNQDAAEMLATFLRGCGHVVRVAHDGHAGLDLATRESPDVVICDIGLPGMDGFELAQHIRRIPALSCVRLIAMTGYGDNRDRDRGLDAGFEKYLVKPADPEAVAQLLAS